MARACLSAALLCAVLAPSGALAQSKVEQPPYPPNGLKGTVTLKRLPAPEHPVLAQGAKVWGRYCVICHGSGNFGAPKITGAALWEPRIAKGLETLFDHALNGFRSEEGGYMPPRGGKKHLTDEEVMGAVRFMISMSGGAQVALQGLED